VGLSKPGNIYMDHNSTAPIHPEVREAMQPEEVHHVVDALVPLVERLRKMSPFYKQG
jgi:hypothetical protein